MSGFKFNALSACRPDWTGLSAVCSDGDGGPDDGTNHIHPEIVFHQDCCQNPFPACAYH